MKYFICSFITILLLGTTTVYTQSNILRGVFLFGRDYVNFGQMRDSLHLNAIQHSQLDSTRRDDSTLKNSAGLKVYNQRSYLAAQSTAQRMVYQAENFSNPLWNYFAYWNPSAIRDSISLHLNGPGTAGYLVESATPNSEYHYGDTRTYYYATFRLKVTSGSDSTQVADCIVYCLNTDSALAHKQVLVSDVSPTGSYYDIVVPFSIDPAPTNPPLAYNGKLLTGRSLQSTSFSLCNNIDLRVNWNGNVTTYLDKVTVDDTLAHNLFAGTYDNAIKQDAGKFTPTNYPLQDKFYLADEPPISAFLGFNYVGNRIKDTLGNNPQSGTVSANNTSFQRFIVDATPYQVMIDPYFFTSEIPHPSIINPLVADTAGIAHWNYSFYLTKLQDSLDKYIPSYFGTAAVAAIQQSKPLIIIPQLHGIEYWRTNKYRDTSYLAQLRPPAPSEIRLIYNIGIAYGAKGFLPYPYGTDYWYADAAQQVPIALPGLVWGRKNNGYYTDHWNNIDTVYGKRIWTGYQEKWAELSSLNNRLMQIGDTLLALTWIGAKSWSNSQTTAGNWSAIVTTVSTQDTGGTPDPTPYVEVGNLQRGIGGTDYIVVVNRRCADNDSSRDRRDINITLYNTKPNWLVTNIETNQSWVVKGNDYFVERFSPGEGKI